MCFGRALLLALLSCVARFAQQEQPAQEAADLGLLHRRVWTAEPEQGWAETVAIAASFWNRKLSLALYVLMVIMHVFPGRIDRHIRDVHHPAAGPRAS